MKTLREFRERHGIEEAKVDGVAKGSLDGGKREHLLLVNTQNL